MLFTDEYITEVRSRLDCGDVDRIELDLLDALDCIERLKADLEWLRDA
jgi:hypothetical protein